ncbi:MAG: SDR family NAD(P)-dependent oxidoreductase [Synechococcaceae cyanobacterium SM2_3_1]|nr:SDR family NAD(P)-dependent oxidoreductase [Synechococcaceae cyanobacterium SM2_3_1]
MSVLANKVAVVTCASSGIGHATAKLFAEEGATVMAAAKRQKELDVLVDSICSLGGCTVVSINRV